MTTTTFELSGGFHNSSPIRIKINGSFNNTTIAVDVRSTAHFF